MDLFSAASEPGAQAFGDPAFWVNLGVAGVFLVAFAMGRVHSQNSMDRVERQAAVSLDRMEKQLERVLVERDRALAERDEAYQVVRDFNQMAAGLIQKIPTISPDPRPRPRRGDSS